LQFCRFFAHLVVKCRLYSWQRLQAILAYHSQGEGRGKRALKWAYGGFVASKQGLIPLINIGFVKVTACNTGEGIESRGIERYIEKRKNEKVILEKEKKFR
jgi:hypothetical protein